MTNFIATFLISECAMAMSINTMRLMLLAKDNWTSFAGTIGFIHACFSCEKSECHSRRKSVLFVWVWVRTSISNSLSFAQGGGSIFSVNWCAVKVSEMLTGVRNGGFKPTLRINLYKVRQVREIGGDHLGTNVIKKTSLTCLIL